MKKTLIALSACATLALAGCGDDGGSDSEELTKAELIEKGDAICAEGDDVIDAAENDFADPENPTVEEIDAAIEDVVLPEYRRQLEELEELEPPADDADTVDEMLEHLEAAIDAMEEDWQSEETSTEFEEASRIATDYGFEECGEEEN
jgi:hypothetical protein